MIMNLAEHIARHLMSDEERYVELMDADDARIDELRKAGRAAGRLIGKSVKTWRSDGRGARRVQRGDTVFPPDGKVLVIITPGDASDSNYILNTYGAVTPVTKCGEDCQRDDAGDDALRLRAAEIAEQIERMAAMPQLGKSERYLLRSLTMWARHGGDHPPTVAEMRGDD